MAVQTFAPMVATHIPSPPEPLPELSTIPLTAFSLGFIDFHRSAITENHADFPPSAQALPALLFILPHTGEVSYSLTGNLLARLATSRLSYQDNPPLMAEPILTDSNGWTPASNVQLLILLMFYVNI